MDAVNKKEERDFASAQHVLRAIVDGGAGRALTLGEARALKAKIWDLSAELGRERQAHQRTRERSEKAETLLAQQTVLAEAALEEAGRVRELLRGLAHGAM